MKEVREAKDELQRLKRKNLQEKLDQAEQRRVTHLQGIVRKAQEDGVKVRDRCCHGDMLKMMLLAMKKCVVHILVYRKIAI